SCCCLGSTRRKCLCGDSSQLRRSRPTAYVHDRCVTRAEKDHPLLMQFFKQVDKSSKYYEFRCKTRLVKPSILHFQNLYKEGLLEQLLQSTALLVSWSLGRHLSA
ncbi:Os10g0408700, partial [Oryza sativa Japonica Group]